MRELLAAVARGAERRPPIFLKVAPDLEAGEMDDIARAAIEAKVDALIVGNTTLSRPPLRSKHRGEAGGLSGAPLKALALQRLKDFRAATGGAMPLIAVGGIENGVDAYARIRAGASLVQLYTALVYQGPGSPERSPASSGPCSAATASRRSPRRSASAPSPSGPRLRAADRRLRRGGRRGR